MHGRFPNHAIGSIYTFHMFGVGGGLVHLMEDYTPWCTVYRLHTPGVRRYKCKYTPALQEMQQREQKDRERMLAILDIEGLPVTP